MRRPLSLLSASNCFHVRIHQKRMLANDRSYKFDGESVVCPFHYNPGFLLSCSWNCFTTQPLNEVSRTSISPSSSLKQTKKLDQFKLAQAIFVIHQTDIKPSPPGGTPFYGLYITALGTCVALTHMGLHLFW